MMLGHHLRHHFEWALVIKTLADRITIERRTEAFNGKVAVVSCIFTNIK